MNSTWISVLLVITLGLVGCDGEEPPPDAQSPRCARDAECDDGLFCNGAERCAPDEAGADEGGCVAPSAPACAEGSSCSEARDLCLPGCADADGDGIGALDCGGDDCDDADPSRYPGNVEVCDVRGLDEDCDPTTYGTRDVDGDGVTDARCCNAGPAGDACGEDCNDAKRSVHPRSIEVCDGTDQDCDGAVDEDAQVVGYPDRDGDGDGDPAGETDVCAGTVRYVATGLDCNDDPEDGGLLQSGRTPEIHDGIDNDCNGIVDDVTGPATFYPDADADGFGDADATLIASVNPVTGYVLNGLDCDDSDADRSPLASEVCNGIDDDCDGAADYRITPIDGEDDDGDGFVDLGCGLGGAPDCDDLDATSYPGAPELCDGRDGDCDGEVDEGCVAALPDGGVDAGLGMDAGPPRADAGSTDAGPSVDAGPPDAGCTEVLYYVDLDEDQYGDASDPRCAASAPAGSTLATGDCDDGDPNRSPRGREWVNALDDDCDGAIDETIVSTAPGQLWVGPQRTCVRDDGGTLHCTGDALPSALPVGDLSLSGGFACSRVGGEVRCLGENGFGQLGNGTTTYGASHGPVSGLTDATGVHVGPSHSCARRATGEVVCWGWGEAGALGHGLFESTLTPVSVTGLADAEEVRVGFDFSCARRAGGTVECWGADYSQQLGNGAGSAAAAPGAVVGLTDAVSLAGGTPQTSLCAVRAGGTIACWGSNLSGQLGDGTLVTPAEPVQVVGIDDALEVVVGAEHACARRATGGVACWGNNDRGQLGNLVYTSSAFPVAVVGLFDPVALVAGSHHTCALRSTGAVVCWGDHSVGQLGFGLLDSSGAPRQVTGVNSATQVACRGDYGIGLGLGGGHGCVRRGDGSVACWGGNGYGQLGDGTTVSRGAPAAVGGLGSASAVAVGALHTCALLASGEIACWGDNSSGQLGDGTGESSSVPVNVEGMVDAVEVVAGTDHTCARRADGEVVCWGKNFNGQVGNGTTVDQLGAVSTGVLDAVELAAGRRHTCARSASGRLFCWGNDITSINSTVPVDLTAAYLGVDGGDFGTCLRQASRSLCFGYVTPGNVPIPADSEELVMGYEHACVRRPGGRVECWGNGTVQGELGDGRYASRGAFPLRVSGLSDAVDLASDGYTTCAVRADGTVVAWGSNSGGVLGVHVTDSPTFVPFARRP